MRLVQLHCNGVRVVATVEEPRLRVVEGFESVYGLAQEALRRGTGLYDLVTDSVGGSVIDYDEVHAGDSQWSLLAPVDHPISESRLMVSGTGLTHLASAQSRQAMHAASAEETDSMRMYRWGVEGGRPAAGEEGISPEWFYKGTGAVLRGHLDTLERPAYAEDGGEEAEIAGVYLIDEAARPRRIGMAAGNEFSDHKLEKRNYLYLASSKLRTCSLGPELWIDPDFEDVQGQVSILRQGELLWSSDLRTGESAMCHSLANMEHHHFKHAAHRRPGDLHAHYFGTPVLSFSHGVELRDGDLMRIEFHGFGRALVNPLKVDDAGSRLFEATPI